MAELIVLLGIVAALHFIYESAVAPTLRLKTRYKLFELRDQIRKLKEDKNLSAQVFQHVDGSINAQIQQLNQLNFSLLYSSNRTFKNDDTIQKEIRRKTELIENCDVEEVKKIYEKSSEYGLEAFLINSGAWLPYITPLLLVLLVAGAMKTLIVKLKSKISEVSLTQGNKIRLLTTDYEVTL